MKEKGQEIERFAKLGIYIDIVCDAYKLDMGVCYRGCVTWKVNGHWFEDDAGCYPNWEDAYEQVIDLADFLSRKY